METIIESGGLFNLDTDLLRGVSGTEQQKEWANIMADALDQYNDNPERLTFEQRYYLEEYRLIEQNELLVRDPDQENLNLTSGTGMDELSYIGRVQNAQSIWLDKDRYRDQLLTAGEFAVLKAANAAKRKQQEDYFKPGTYGQTMTGQMPTWSMGTMFYADGSEQKLQTDYEPIASIGTYEMYLEREFLSRAYNEVAQSGVPLYQETDMWGFDPAVMNRYYELQDKVRDGKATPAEKSEFNDLDNPYSGIPALRWENGEEANLFLTTSPIGAYYDEKDRYNGLWFDPTRLYMKLPGMEVTPEQRAERSVAHNDSLSFEPAYHNFSNEYQGEDVENTSQLDYSPLTGEPGYFIDATGGHAEMGTYSMIFVATPRPDPDDWWDDFLRNPIVNFVASFTPLTAIALAATKRLSGHTLKTGDYDIETSPLL